MVGHGGSSAGSYLADPTSPIPSHCASIVATSTLRVNIILNDILHVSSLSTYFFHYYLVMFKVQAIKNLVSCYSYLFVDCVILKLDSDESLLLKPCNWPTFYYI